MSAADKLLFVHNGALGDFLLAWPALYALARWWGEEKERGAERRRGGIGGKPPYMNKRTAVRRLFPPAPPFPPKTSMGFVGDKQRTIWTEVLGMDFREPCDAREIDRLYGADTWPEKLSNTLVVWPVLGKRPQVPEHDNLWFLPGIIPGRRQSPRTLYLEALAARGVDVGGDPAPEFKRLFAAGRHPDKTVALFPGAGHERKAWPLVKFLELAGRLAQAGLSPRFVLGPAERELGLTVPDYPCFTPASLAELQDVLLASDAAVGGDTGPLHLAAMLGLPTLALFGPTDPAVWKPYGARVIAAACDQAPCVTLATDIACRHGDCLANLPAATVYDALMPLLGR